MSENLYSFRLVGIISKPHALKGEVSLKLITDYPNTILKGSVFFIDENPEDILEIESIKNTILKSKDMLIVQFKGIYTREQAETICGKMLFREESESPKLKKNFYWLDDLKGCKIISRDGIIIGHVDEILKNPVNDVIIMATDKKSDYYINTKLKELLIPLTDDYIDEIKIIERIIKLKTIPEYF